MINVALIGVNHPHIFTIIEEVLSCPDDFKIVAICDDCEAKENVKKACVMLPDAVLYQSEDKLYEKADFEAVLSSGIFAKKGALACRALKAHKHLLFDKPLSTNEEDFKTIETLVNENADLKIALWLTERYSPTYFTAHELILAGEIGEIVHMMFVRPHRLAPQTRPFWHLDQKWYGGIMCDIGVHDADLARWFTNSECQKIEGAHVGNKRFTDIPMNDYGMATLTMDSGATCTLFENWLTPDAFPIHGDTRAIIYGTKGQIEIKAYPESVILCNDNQAPHEVILKKPKYNGIADFAQMFRHSDYKPLITTHDAVLSTKLALSIQKEAEKE